MISNICFALAGVLVLVPCGSARAAALDSPLDWQIAQRDARGSANIRIAGTCPTKTGLVEAKAELAVGHNGKSTGWTVVARGPQLKFAKPDGGSSGTFRGSIQLAAGGWYTLKVRFRKAADEPTAAAPALLGEATVAHFGVGEVFVVAGQSNSANHGEERQKSLTGLVAAFDGSRWQPANDPQPGASGGGGSFMPPFGDSISAKFKVPVGIVACGIGATSIREWLPKNTKFPNPPTLTGRVQKLSSGQWASDGRAFDMFVARMKQLGPHGFRAVLWHQGESDANQADPSRTLPGDLYRQYLEQLIKDSRREIGWDAPWFVAQASYHTPADPSSPEIRAAQKAVSDDGIALLGPDTDALKGELREQHGRGVHFSARGLREHAARWFEKVAPWLAKQPGAGPGDGAAAK
ncbi:MAG TPA: sialate O-acetylesterase [Pirellulales bacterium]|nr:sialate O-acetylesterase [Pirellulales bacterium]